MKTEEEHEGFAGMQPDDISKLNNKERRRRSKYFKKMLKDHIKRKPKVSAPDFEDASEGEAQEKANRLKIWLSRYMVLLKKINDLEGPNKDYKRLFKLGTPKDEVIVEGEGEDGEG